MTTNFCRKCKLDKPSTEFTKGRLYTCRLCYNAYMAAWRIRDPKRLVQLNAKQREQQKHVLANPDQKAKLYASMAKWRADNKERVNEQGRIRQKKYRADPVLHEKELVRKRKYAVKDRERNLAYAKQRQDERQALIWRIKDVPCKDCGDTFPPYCMDFDHVTGTKTANISEMKSYSMDRILDEVAKCDIVCSNCHRIRTYQRNSNSKGS